MVLARGMFPKSYAITAIKRVIMSITTPSQKTSSKRPLGILQHAFLTTIVSKEINGLVLKTYEIVIASVSL